MDRKLLFFDVDGTIVTARHFIPPSAAEALRRALEGGHVLMINTGRTLRHVEPQVRALPVSGFICSLGGHIFLNGRELCYYTLDRDECCRIRDLGYSCGMDMLFESEEAVWYDRRCVNPHGEREFGWLTSIGVPGYRDTGLDNFQFDKFVCWPREGGDRERFRHEIADRYDMIDREHNMMEVVQKGLSKAWGMRLVMERLGICMEDVYAFGDGPNDLPMLQAAGHSALLGNAPKSLWSEAEYVAKPIDQNGLWDAMAHFGLI